LPLPALWDRLSLSGGRGGSSSSRGGALGRILGLSELRLEVCRAVLGNLPESAFGAELLPKVAQLRCVITHNHVQPGGDHPGKLLGGRCALCVQCMHMRTCAPNIQGIPLYTVNLTFTFNNLVRCYAPNLNPVMYGITMNPEEFGGLPNRNVVLLGLALLCALCTVLSHPGILD
jgi:hypothetical protein